MSAAEKLRKQLHQYIDQVDERFLKVVHAMFEAYNEEQTDFWDELSDEQKARIEQSRQEHREGKSIPHEDVMKEFRKSIVHEPPR
ncbi:MAG: hypothetical protein AAGG75_02480 [Bacteroidota bacterium]